MLFLAFAVNISLSLISVFSPPEVVPDAVKSICGHMSGVCSLPKKIVFCFAFRCLNFDNPDGFVDHEPVELSQIDGFKILTAGTDTMGKMLPC